MLQNDETYEDLKNIRFYKQKHCWKSLQSFQAFR